MVAFLFLMLVESVSASPFRVLVFPHQGAYPIPQGSEKNISSVKVTSSNECHQYSAQLNQNQEWVKTGNLITSQKEFNLSSSQTFNSLYFDCPSPFRIHREKGLDSYEYEGDFVAIQAGNGKSKFIQIVNLIDAEKYIQGVVPSEVGSQWPTEALRSQSIAARTFAWWTVLTQRKSAHRDFDLDDTVQFQAYLGISSRYQAADQAVKDTENQVMKYQGKVIKSYFSADSGGTSESAIHVFGQDLPYCVSKQELYDLSKTKTEWEKKYNLAEMSALLKKKLIAVEVSSTDVNQSGRVDFVTLTTESNQKTKMTGASFRRLFKLRSTLFQLKTNGIGEKAEVTLTGRGYGHGVGMAQIGAREYANQLGWSFEQILKHYYTGITIEKITNEDSL